MEEIYFGEDAKNKLYNGIEKLYKAVSSTMGPNGKTVVILDEYNRPGVTKDGVSVARAISFKDPIENIGAQFVKQAAENTVNEAGDGTTTATVLAYALIKNLKDFNILDINKALDEIIPQVIEELKKNSRQLKNEDIKYVASISANNDIQIGELIQQAFNFSRTVKVEESINNEDTLHTIEGMQLDVSYFSKHFINVPKKAECNFTKPKVLLIEGKIDKLNNIAELISKTHEQDKELLIITEGISEVALKYLETNVLSLGLKVCVIKTPGFGPHRKDLIQDLSKFTGASILSDLSKPIDNMNLLGELESCKISKSNSLLIKSNNIDIYDYIFTLEQLLKSDSLELYDKDLLNKRIEGLNSKVSIIKVGGRTELEMKERKDRYDDAVLAVSSALEEGIVEGGGKALSETIRSFTDQINISSDPNNDIIISSVDIDSIEGSIAFSLIFPYNKIVENGCNIIYEDNMFDKNIIDPLKVTRCALENAVSVARTILSTDTVVLNEYLWKQ